MISQRAAALLLAAKGPRFLFEVSSASGAGANLEHPLWRRRGIRFDVHIDVRNKTAAQAATSLVVNIQAFKDNFSAAQLLC